MGFACMGLSEDMVPLNPLDNDHFPYNGHVKVYSIFQTHPYMIHKIFMAEERLTIYGMYDLNIGM